MTKQVAILAAAGRRRAREMSEVASMMAPRHDTTGNVLGLEGKVVVAKSEFG